VAVAAAALLLAMAAGAGYGHLIGAPWQVLALAILIAVGILAAGARAASSGSMRTWRSFIAILALILLSWPAAIELGGRMIRW
jgi:hypothetical protein